MVAFKRYSLVGMLLGRYLIFLDTYLHEGHMVRVNVRIITITMSGIIAAPKKEIRFT